MRVKGGNINLKKSAPAKISDMKQGEWRVNENGIYVRDGNQILAKNWGAWAENLAGITDEFNDESIDSKWSFADSGGASHAETADGMMTFTFGGGANQDAVTMQQDPVGAVAESIPPEALVRMQIRSRVQPYLYTANQTSYGSDIYQYTGSQWNLWDNDIYWTFEIDWCYGGHPSGYDMYGFESCYIFQVDVYDEYNSTGIIWGPSALIASGRADFASPVPVDETHNGWFTFRFTKTPAGKLKFEIQPDGSETWYDLTPSGLTDYDLNIGGKNSYAWGFDIYGRENNGPSYTGSSQGPVKVDWLRL